MFPFPGHESLVGTGVIRTVKLVRYAAFVAATVALSGCGKDISGAVDQPPLFPVERLQPASSAYVDGAMRERGKGRFLDERVAATEYRQAADAGDVRAMVDLGVMYAQGRGVARDYSQAASLFKRAADAGSALGRYNLALLHLSGEGTALDPEAASRLLREAAMQGHLRSMSLLATLIETGTVQAEPGLATRLHKMAAARGEREEIVQIVPPSERSDATRPVVLDAVKQLVAENCRCSQAESDRSAREFVNLLTSGTEGSWYELGVRYRDGEGVERDPRAAARAFATSARMGNPAAQYELARMRLAGTGVAPDISEAHALLVAASRGSGMEAWQAKDLRRRVEEKLSKRQIEDGIERADAGLYGEVDGYGRPR